MAILNQEDQQSDPATYSATLDTESTEEERKKPSSFCSALDGLFDVMDRLSTEEHAQALSVLMLRYKPELVVLAGRTSFDPSLGEKRAEQVMSEVMGLAAGNSDLATKSAKTAPSVKAKAADRPALSVPAKSAPTTTTQPKKDSDEEAGPRVPAKYWITLGSLLMILVLVWGIPSLTGQSPSGLANKALSTAAIPERVNAAVELASDQNPHALNELRRVAQKSDAPEVVSIALAGLANKKDVDSLKVFLDCMRHGDKSVREAGFGAFCKVVNLPKNPETDYNPNDPQDIREPMVLRLEQMYLPRTLAKAK